MAITTSEEQSDHPTTVYVFKEVDKQKETESKRLTDQYNLFKVILERTSPVPSTIDLSSIKTVLDVAAGNCVWILDVANQPVVRDRIRGASTISVKGDGDVELYACDIDLNKFPNQIIREMGITSFQQDVTKAFPEHMQEKFDLVHMSAMCGVLSEEQWKSSMVNIRYVLKPGGRIILCDWHGVLYPTEQAMPPPSWNYDPTELQRSYPSHWLNKYRTLIPDSFAKGFDLVPELAYRLPLFVEGAFMKVDEQTPIIIPLGPSSDTSVHPARELLSIYKSDTVTLAKSAILYLMKHGRYPVINPFTGLPFTDYQELENVIEWANERLDAEGAFSCWIEIVGTK